MNSKKILFINALVMTILFNGCGSSGSQAPPEITSLQPDHGPPGTLVTINGKNFSSEKPSIEVSFNGTSGTVESTAEAQIEATVPEGASSGQVTVSIDGKKAVGPNFTVEAKAPGISTVDPDSGVVGTQVVIKGMNFSAIASENGVTFNGVSATISSASETELVTEVPGGATDGPVEVTVKQKSTTGPNFDVITTGTIEAIIATSGPDQDPDGYTVGIDGSQGSAVDAIDTLYVNGLEEGTHNAELSGLASNCGLSGNNPRSVTIAAGDTTSTTFEISCREVLNNKIVFTSDRDGDFELYVMNADGSSPQQLTHNSGLVDAYSSISYNGSRIVYAHLRDQSSFSYSIHVMNADGTDNQALTTAADSSNYLPTWSPDGSKIAFVSTKGAGTDTDIYVMNSDGTNMVNITQSDSSVTAPSWSPDGNHILYSSARGTGTDYELYRMNTDGTGVVQLTDNTYDESNPEWSPDGSQIVFESYRDGDGDGEIHVMNADGTGIIQMTSNTYFDAYPTWSPDGSHIAFDSNRDGNYDVYKINADGSGLPVNLTANSSGDRIPSWSPVE